MRSAVRMAMQEVEKIADLKKQVDDEQAKEQSRKEEEKDKTARIESLKAEIADAKRKNEEAVELPEETELRNKNREWEDLMKRKEEQDEKLTAHKNYQAKL